jgi:hypothetical protein
MAAGVTMKVFEKIGSAWSRFWFTPADPTPLCLMRIVAGLLVLYVHVAYCFDLQALFGPDGWYPTQMANRERREYPVAVLPSAWMPRNRLQMPENSDQRRALRVFMGNLAADPTRQQQAFRLLSGIPSSDLSTWYTTMGFLRGLRVDPVERTDQLNNMLKAAAEEGNSDVRGANERLYGTYVLNLTPSLREQFRTDAEALADVLPPDPRQRRALFVLLLDPTTGGPKSIELLQTFVAKMTAKCDTAAKRTEYLDYLEYWSIANDDEGMVHIGHPYYSPYYHVTSPAGMNLLHGVHLAVIVLFTLGVCTRVTSVLTWLAALAYMQRNPIALFGQDTMMNMCLFYLMLAPCGATWSVDWLVNRYRAGRDALAAGRRPPAESAPRPMISANVVIRLVQIHYCLMYMSAGLSKLKGDSWWRGTAVWYTMTNPEFSPLHIPFFREGLVWLTQDSNRWLWETYMGIMNVFTLSLEIGLPFLVWTRLRPIVVAGAIMLHMGIALNMGLVVFSLFMFTLLVAWMPPFAIRKVFARPPSKLPKLVVRFDAAEPRQRPAAALVYAADVWQQAELEQTATTAVEVVSSGTVSTGVAAACRLVRDLSMTQSVRWLLCPLLRLPGLSNLVANTFGGPDETAPAPTSPDDRKRAKTMASR